ncbi:hypothetical protein V2J09_004221 [Rumex salicifolius]
MLRFKGILYIGTNSSLRSQLVTAMHSEALGGHSGIQGTYQRLKSVFYWPNMKADVEVVIFINKTRENMCITRDLFNLCLFLSSIEGLPKSQGKDVIMVVVDRLTKYEHFIPLAHSFTASKVAHEFMLNVYKMHGVPLTIVSDRDQVFLSHF